MTNQKPRDDLSTEQIMASIGRIVAEGEGHGHTPDDGPPVAAAPAPAEGEDGDEDILDLVDVVDEQGNVIPPERAFAGTPALPSSPPGERASEEQVLKTLRPMLQTWLDTHMPPIVERLVEREIERAAHRSEPE